MHLSTTAAVFSSAFVAMVSAVAEPATPVQSSEAAVAVLSYISALQTNPIQMSIASALSTQPSAASVISSLDAELLSVIPISLLPTPYQSFYSSVYEAEFSILEANRISGLSATGASEGGVPTPTITTGASGSTITSASTTSHSSATPSASAATATGGAGRLSALGGSGLGKEVLVWAGLVAGVLGVMVGL